ncbi:MAG: PEP-CTERM sorting domain-containing protein [Massilia sp.]
MNANARLVFPWRRLTWGLLFWCVLFSAPAYADPPPLQPIQYSAVIDPTSGQANFSLRFDHAPDFFTVDNAGRPPDAFELFTDTRSSDPIQSAIDGLNGSGQLGTQTIISGYAITTRRQLEIWWPKPVSEWIPGDPDSQAVLRTYRDYTQVGDTLSFSLPLSLLHNPDGVFYYGFQLFRYGGWTTVNYYGVSGQEYVFPTPPVPEPAHAAMLGAGILLLGATCRRGRRRK